MERTYAGCLFDIDGTLTVRGDEFIPVYMHEILANMCLSVPMAVCSARRLSHAYEKMAVIFTKSDSPQVCQENWVLICENGSIGYIYNTPKGKYEEFYRVPYPYDDAHRKNLFNSLNNVLEGKLSSSFLNEVGMVFRPANLDDPDREALAARSHELAAIATGQLSKSDPKGCLKIGDSAIGINIFPYQGNKEYGTLQFAKYLRDTKGINVEADAKELVVVGDQPQPLGNDETFLNGKYGTPFTVGMTHPDNIEPLPVYDLVNGRVLTGPEGTKYLLNNLKFRTL